MFKSEQSAFKGSGSKLLKAGLYCMGDYIGEYDEGH